MGAETGQPGTTADRFADDPAFAVHEGGKLAVRPTRGITSREDLALTYTPGVARDSSAIAAEPALARRFTWAPRVVSALSERHTGPGLRALRPTAHPSGIGRKTGPLKDLPSPSPVHGARSTSAVAAAG